MLKVAIAEHNQILDEIVKSFPAQLLIAAEELIYDLIRSGKVDVAVIPQSALAERRFSHWISLRFHDQMVVCSSSLSNENQLLFEDFRLRLTTTCNAENKYLLRMIASTNDADRILELLRASYHTDVFIAKSDDLARFETVTELAAFYDVLAKLREAGGRQISLIPIEKHY